MVITWQQIVGLFVLAIPIACIARTVVFEDVFREPREWCRHRSRSCARLLHRKFFYLFTCEYCFSHYVALFFLLVTHFTLLFPDWRGYLISFFSLVFVANIYLNLYGRIRLEISGQKKAIEASQKQIEVSEKEVIAKDREIEKLDLELGKPGGLSPSPGIPGEGRGGGRPDTKE